jgi:hypothetical protein
METQLLTSILALAGTIFVAGLGYAQWKKQHGKPNRGAIAMKMREASEKIWTELEEINLFLREDRPKSRKSINAIKKRINTVILKNSLYLDDALQSLINDYTQSLIAVTELLINHGTDEDKEEWRSTRAVWFAQEDTELQEALRTMSTLRQKIKTKLREHAGA